MISSTANLIIDSLTIYWESRSFISFTCSR